MIERIQFLAKRQEPKPETLQEAQPHDRESKLGLLQNRLAQIESEIADAQLRHNQLAYDIERRASMMSAQEITDIQTQITKLKAIIREKTLVAHELRPRVEALYQQELQADKKVSLVSQWRSIEDELKQLANDIPQAANDIIRLQRKSTLLKSRSSTLLQQRAALQSEMGALGFSAPDTISRSNVDQDGRWLGVTY